MKNADKPSVGESIEYVILIEELFNGMDGHTTVA